MIRLSFKFILFLLSIVSAIGQNDAILCESCIKQLIIQESITDILVSDECVGKIIFKKSNGSDIIRYSNDICNTPIVIDQQFCTDWKSIGTTCSTSFTCDIEVIMAQGVECILPQIVATGQFLNPCEYDFDVPAMDGPLGTKYKIGYTELSGCFSTCQQGLPIRLNCVDLSDPSNDNDFEYCSSFENYNVGNISPQGNPAFTLFSNLSSQQAAIVTTKSFIGNKSLKFGNGSDIDFNISRQLTESMVARIDWQLYMDEGKSGAIGVETNNPSNYPFWVEMESNTMSIWGFVNDVATKLSIDFAKPLNCWMHFAIIFQPFENQIELWVNSSLIHTVTNYQSNTVTDLNFFGITGRQNTEYYVDQICYKEWSRDKPCPAVYFPVCVNNQSFGNCCEAGLSGYTTDECFMGSCGYPGCPELTAPLVSPIPVNTLIQWTAVEKVILYLLTVRVNGVTWFENKNVGNQTFYNLTDLPFEASINIEVVAVNSNDINGCFYYSFTTASNVSTPQCASIVSPLNNAQNTDISLQIRWNPSSNATGYRLKLGSTDGGNDLLNTNLGNVTSYQANNLPYDKQIYVTVIPYNSAGDAQNCTSQKFTTKKEAMVPSCTQLSSPSNNEQNVPTTINILWTPISEATGYKINIANAAGGQIMPTITVGNVSNYIVEGLPTNTFICIKVTPINAAGEASSCTAICFKTVISSATNEAEKLNVSIFPNPTEGLVYMSSDGTHSTLGSIYIYDILGHLVSKNMDYQTKEPIDLSEVPSGLYTVILTNYQGQKIFKLQKK